MMTLSGNIKHVARLVMWIVPAAAILVLLIAAVRSKNSKICTGVEIDINGSVNGKWFVEEKEVMNLITANGHEKLKGRALQFFNLQQLEARLKKDVWIREAQLFFDANNVLQVKIEERIPVARVFTNSGASFYIDSTLERLPLSSKLAVRLPVFTGFPADRTSQKKSDRLLLQELKKMSLFLLNDPFWMAQVAQVDITYRREFEIIPTIGNHVIIFGDGNDMEKKFGGLLLFYEQVASKTGFEKYSQINLRYNGQVIGVRKEEAAIPIADAELNHSQLKQLNTIQ